MDQTFYIATHGDNLLVVRAISRRLQEAGYRWHEGWDWTAYYKQNETVAVALMDKICARDCDIFVFLYTEQVSHGANREYGIRWGTGRPIHVIGGEHLFDLDPQVIVHRTVTEFFKWLTR